MLGSRLQREGNLSWAFAYDVAALPLATGLLNLMLAGATTALSWLFVVTNSLRLRGFRPLTTDAGARWSIPHRRRPRASPRALPSLVVLGA